MKQIVAIVQPFMASDVLDALHRIEGVSGVMNSEVRCTNASCGHLNPDINTRIELFIPETLVDEVLQTIGQYARTGRAGDGRIFVIDLEQTVVIRNGQHEIS